MGIDSFFRFLFPKKEPLTKDIDLLVIGLGNPGSNYYSTRHNIGFRCLESFQQQLQNCREFSLSNTSLLSGYLTDNKHVVLAKPLTFMNRSGESVKVLLNTFNVINKMLVIVDDFNLRIGTIRFRRKGSDGGHNGLKSLIEHIGNDFSRLRIGIGPLPDKTGIIDFVLGQFSKEEEKELDTLFPKINNAIISFAAEPIDAVMNQYN